MLLLPPPQQPLQTVVCVCAMCLKAILKRKSGAASSSRLCIKHIVNIVKTSYLHRPSLVGIWRWRWWRYIRFIRSSHSTHSEWVLSWRVIFIMQHNPPEASNIVFVSPNRILSIHLHNAFIPYFPLSPSFRSFFFMCELLWQRVFSFNFHWIWLIIIMERARLCVCEWFVWMKNKTPESPYSE